MSCFLCVAKNIYNMRGQLTCSKYSYTMDIKINDWQLAKTLDKTQDPTDELATLSELLIEIKIKFLLPPHIHTTDVMYSFY